MAHRVKEASDVGIQDVVHLGAGDPDAERVQRIVRAAPRPEAIAEAEEVFLVDHVQHHARGPLDELVFESRDRQRALLAVGLGDEPSAGGQRAIAAPMNPSMQILDAILEVRLVVLPHQPVHTGGGIALEREERGPEQVGGEVVEERGEPFLLLMPCGLPYTVQSL